MSEKQFSKNVFLPHKGGAKWLKMENAAIVV